MNNELEYFKSRTLNFENAGVYDKMRHSPASEEAHEIWAYIVDKPHYALQYIQKLINERDVAVNTERQRIATKFRTLAQEELACGKRCVTNEEEYEHMRTAELLNTQANEIEVGK